MDRISTRLKKLLFPGGKLVFLLAVLGAVSLYLAFATWLEETPFDYLAYVLSAYALTVLVAWIVTKAIPALNRLLHSFSLSHRYLTDDYFKVWASLLLSFLINLGNIPILFMSARDGFEIKTVRGLGYKAVLK